MRWRERLPRMGRAVCNCEEKDASKRRADQAGQYGPAKTLAATAGGQYANRDSQSDPEADE